MKKFFLTLGSRLVSAVRLCLGALLLVPFLALLVHINYSVDCQGYYLGDTYLREIANMLFSGENVAEFNQLNKREREVLEVIVANMDTETVPETISLGSSRILQLNRDMVGTTFYNSATSGGDFNDILSAFALYDNANKLPENIIIGLDPWIFNTDIDANGKNTDTSLSSQFVTEKLGIPAPYSRPDPAEKWKYLFDLTYFQGNVEYLLDGAFKGEEPVTVSESVLFEQDSEVKRPDGSLVYSLEYRTKPQSEADNLALIVASTDMFRLDSYLEPDAKRAAVFEQWIQYMQGEGINLIFILSPYHPTVYDKAVAYPERYSGLMETEALARRLGIQYNIPVYGSYNPYAAGIDETAFYDGLHPRGEVLASFFPGVPQALADRDAGVDVSLDSGAVRPDSAA